jgi:hypothetical protein
MIHPCMFSCSIHSANKIPVLAFSARTALRWKKDMVLVVIKNPDGSVIVKKAA